MALPKGHKQCKVLYYELKQQCKEVFEDVMCNSHNVDRMTVEELLRHLKMLYVLSEKSKKCYELRREYMIKCINKDDHDQGHLRAINTAKQYNDTCAKEIEKVKKRLQYLNDLMRQAETLVNEIDGESWIMPLPKKIRKYSK